MRRQVELGAWVNKWKIVQPELLNDWWWRLMWTLLYCYSKIKIIHSKFALIAILRGIGATRGEGGAMERNPGLTSLQFGQHSPLLPANLDFFCSLFFIQSLFCSLFVMKYYSARLLFRSYFVLDKVWYLLLLCIALYWHIELGCAILRCLFYWCFTLLVALYKRENIFLFKDIDTCSYTCNL